MRVFLQWLKEPFYLNASWIFRLRQSLLFAAFVFLFLFFFKPFGLSGLGPTLLLAALGYALLTLLVMVVLNLLLPIFLPQFFDEEKWNVGRELFWSFTNVFLIGLGNAYYGFFIGIDLPSFKSICIFEAYTIGVALFPISLSVLIKETRSKKEFTQQSETMNEVLQTQEHTVEESTTQSLVKMSSAAGTESLTLDARHILFISAADNYIEVKYLEANQIQRKVLRNSLKAIEDSLQNHSDFWRCHKSYLVNLHLVIKTSGNAQGYKLHFKDTDLTVPVSRSNNAQIKQKLKR